MRRVGPAHAGRKVDGSLSVSDGTQRPGGLHADGAEGRTKNGAEDRTEDRTENRAEGRAEGGLDITVAFSLA